MRVSRERQERKGKEQKEWRLIDLQLTDVNSSAVVDFVVPSEYHDVHAVSYFLCFILISLSLFLPYPSLPPRPPLPSPFSLRPLFWLSSLSFVSRSSVDLLFKADTTLIYDRTHATYRAPQVVISSTSQPSCPTVQIIQSISSLLLPPPPLVPLTILFFNLSSSTHHFIACGDTSSIRLFKSSSNLSTPRSLATSLWLKLIIWCMNSLTFPSPLSLLCPSPFMLVFQLNL